MNRCTDPQPVVSWGPGDKMQRLSHRQELQDAQNTCRKCWAFLEHGIGVWGVSVMIQRVGGSPLPWGLAHASTIKGNKDDGDPVRQRID